MTRRGGRLLAALATGVAIAGGPDSPAVLGLTASEPDRPSTIAPIGRPAPLLELPQWIHSKPLEPSELHGRVVLIRWWTDTCPFCEATAPALRELQRRYGDRGLTVIGIFHPKPPGDESVERMRRAADFFGFGFPVALDAHWQALRRWWLKDVPDGWTSVTFLIDRKGIIRLVHPGGEYHTGSGGNHWPDHASCRREYAEIEKTIERLLAE